MANDSKTAKSTPAVKAVESYVTITNKEKRLRTYNLSDERIRDHGTHGYQRITRVKTEHNAKTGVVTSRPDRHTVPQSLTFLASESKKNLPAIVAATKEIKRAESMGKLKIEYQEAFEEEPAALEPPKKPAAPPQPSETTEPAKA